MITEANVDETVLNPAISPLDTLQRVAKEWLSIGLKCRCGNGAACSICEIQLLLEEALKEKKAVDPECNPIEYAKICEQCEDKLTGHEDESGTLCRWCVTCTEVTEGESIAMQADGDA